KALYVENILRPTADSQTSIAKRLAPVKDSMKGEVALSKRMVMNAVESTLWRTGELVFNHEPLNQVLETFNRKLHVTIKAAPELEDQPVTLKVTDEPLDEILFEITQQVKRTRMAGSKQIRESTQYKKLGSEYYIE